jgi:hypothetical protein
MDAGETGECVVGLVVERAAVVEQLDDDPVVAEQRGEPVELDGGSLDPRASER